MRTGNGSNDRLIKRLSAGIKVTVLQEGDPWIKVAVDGKEGYVRRCFVTYQEGVMESAEDGQFIGSTVYLYAEPSTKSERIFKVPQYSTINVVDTTIDLSLIHI